MKTLKGSSLAVTELPEWKQEHGTRLTWKPHLPSVNLPESRAKQRRSVEGTKHLPGAVQTCRWLTVWHGSIKLPAV